MEWENHLEKNLIQKIEKTVKIRAKFPHENKKRGELEKPVLKKQIKIYFFKIYVKMPHMSKKPLARNGNLVQTKN